MRVHEGAVYHFWIETAAAQKSVKLNEQAHSLVQKAKEIPAKYEI